MKLLLAGLVLANLLALAWWQGWIDAWRASAGLVQSPPAEIAADQVRVVPVSQLQAAPAGVAEALPDRGVPQPGPELQDAAD